MNSSLIIQKNPDCFSQVIETLEKIQSSKIPLEKLQHIISATKAIPEILEKAQNAAVYVQMN